MKTEEEFFEQWDEWSLLFVSIIAISKKDLNIFTLY